jgi:hypothetical protein
VWTNLIKHKPAAKLTIDLKFRAVFSQRSATRFSKSIDDEINFVNGELLQIYSEKKPRGLFIYEGIERPIAPVNGSISNAEAYEDFISEIFSAFWKVTEVNLLNVRYVLMTLVLPRIGTALETFEADLREGRFDRSMPALMTAIPLARQDMRAAIERVASWFTLSANSEYQDFDLEIAYRAALSSVKTYYSNITIQSNYRTNPESIIFQGWCLPIFARLFFIILDNAAFHGASEGMHLDISTSVSLTEGGLFSLRVANTLPNSIDFSRLQMTINNINEVYGDEKTRDMVGQERGSGYLKYGSFSSLTSGVDIR